MLSKKEAAEAVLAAKVRLGLSWSQIAEAVGRPVAWTTSALLGQQPMTTDEAKSAGSLLDLDKDVLVALLTEMQVGMALRRATFAGGWPWTADEVVFYHRTKNRKEIDFVGEPLAGTAVEGKYIETGRWRGEAVTVTASDWAGVLTTRNVLDCTDPADAWAVPAGILAALTDN